MAGKEKAVVDASVLLKLFVNERGAAQAIRLRDDHLAGRIVIVIPDMAFLEVLNSLRYKGHDEYELNRVARALLGYQFSVEEPNQFLLEDAIKLALKHNLTIYDAVYAALAEMHEIPLITSDRAQTRIPNSVLIT